MLEKFSFRREIGRNFFCYVVINEWNGLSNHIVSAAIIESFKRTLDKLTDENHWRNWAAVLTQGLPRGDLTVSPTFSHFLTSVCACV